jgi:hypothetical protein
MKKLLKDPSRVVRDGGAVAAACRLRVDALRALAAHARQLPKLCAPVSVSIEARAMRVKARRVRCAMRVFRCVLFSELNRHRSNAMALS